MRRNLIRSLSLALIIGLIACSSTLSRADDPKKADTGDSLSKEKIVALNELAATLKASKDTVKDKKTAEDAAAKIKPKIDKLNDILKRFAALKLDDKEKMGLTVKYQGEYGQALLAVATATGGLAEVFKKVPETAAPLLPALQSLSEAMQALSKE